MTDYTELKQLAEACGDLNWRAIQENWCEWAIRDNHAYIAIMRTKSARHPGPCPDREAKAKFVCAMTPSVVLALIAESERLSREEKNDAIAYKSVIEKQDELRAERDQLKAENEALRKDADLYQQVQIAAGSLPDGWEILLRIENGFGGIDLIDPYGTTVDLDNVDESLGESVASAIAFAASNA